VTAGGMFRAAGRASWGVGEGRAAGMAEVERRARDRGLPPVRWPEAWPNDGLRAMRAAVVGGKPFARAAFRIQFVDGRALSDDDAIAAAAERAGLDPAAVLAATGDPAIKAQLRANTDRALAAGAVGVPAVLVGGAVLWGDDRLEEAAARASHRA
jgi:2-hydroxychromene-2-carboxylate isomerase